MNSATRLAPLPPNIDAMGLTVASGSLALNDVSQHTAKLAFADGGDKVVRPVSLTPSGALGIQVFETTGVQIKPPVVTVPGFGSGVSHVTYALALWAHEIEQRILLAMDSALDQLKRVARFCAFDPELVA